MPNGQTMQDLCPGHYCEDPDYPVLDWDEQFNECHCRVIPCSDWDGEKHECHTPIMLYREEHPQRTGEPLRKLCECAMRLLGRPLGGELGARRL